MATPKPTIKQIRVGIAEKLATVAGLNASPTVPDSVNPPAAVVFGPELDYDSTMSRGSDDYRFWIILLVNRNDEHSAQDLVDSYISPFGDNSVKVAVESDGSNLDGLVDFVRVREVREYGEQTANGVSFFGAAILVEVTA